MSESIVGSNSHELLLSVVVPAYNYAKTLPRAVSSVLAQPDQSMAELLVINDGSTDDTQQVIERLQAENPGRFRAVTKANGGLSSVRNLGIREAVGAYLIFLDADDELAPGALSALAAHIAEHPQTRMVIGGHCSISADGKRREHLPAALPESPIERLRGYLLDKRLALSNGACAMHRDIFARADYPETFRSAEDIPVFAQTLANYECTVLAKPLALIYKHDDSLRHQFSHAKAGGLALVEEVFAPRRLGDQFQVLKSEYYVQRCLSLFRSAYLADDIAAAKEYFSAAFKRDWRVLLKASYGRKALRLWLGLGR